MKKNKLLFILVLSVLSCLCLCGCLKLDDYISASSILSSETDLNIKTDFIIFTVESGSTFTRSKCILIDKETGVQYIYIYGNESCAITPRLDSDGNVLVYEFDENEKEGE